MSQSDTDDDDDDDGSKDDAQPLMQSNNKMSDLDFLRAKTVQTQELPEDGAGEPSINDDHDDNNDGDDGQESDEDQADL